MDAVEKFSWNPKHVDRGPCLPAHHNGWNAGNLVEVSSLLGDDLGVGREGSAVVEISQHMGQNM